ncbi:hypothetical protein PMIN01_11833 [Paraphaeosphaeria minitans]|uniref:Uncharacterized protein n=1 Tax=Paraphaeosphaeria minitans TaxID=565426 RepID=A0A9P6G7K3_9PLEO|nr:hypothetical protein PMIN01_11833 [Paraphaeosphaeria minitans]
MYKKVASIESLVRLLLSEVRQIATGPHTNPAFTLNDRRSNEDSEDVISDSNDDVLSDSNDDARVVGLNKEENIEGDVPKNVSCPHPDCKESEGYAQRRNMQRHFTNPDVKCEEPCAFCGRPSSTVRQYMNHLDKCRTKTSQCANFESLNEIATQRAQNLRQKAAQELSSMSQNLMDPGGAATGTKRKSDAMISHSHKHIGEGTHELVAALGASDRPEVLETPSVHVLPQWTGHEDSIAAQSGALSTDLMEMQSSGGQYVESTLLAPFIDARTLDWSTSYMMEYNGVAGPYAERMITHEHAIDQNTAEASNRRLTQFCDVGNIGQSS